MVFLMISEWMAATPLTALLPTTARYAMFTSLHSAPRSLPLLHQGRITDCLLSLLAKLHWRRQQPRSSNAKQRVSLLQTVVSSGPAGAGKALDMLLLNGHMTGGGMQTTSRAVQAGAHIFLGSQGLDMMMP